RRVAEASVIERRVSRRSENREIGDERADAAGDVAYSRHEQRDFAGREGGWGGTVDCERNGVDNANETHRRWRRRIEGSDFRRSAAQVNERKPARRRSDVRVRAFGAVDRERERAGRSWRDRHNSALRNEPRNIGGE